ncbi:MAG: HflK protein, partial [Halocynthiibacter sp.]
MSGNNGPWGGGSGGSNGPNGNRGGNNGGKRPNDPQVPDFDEIVKKGQDQLRVLMGGKGGGG